MLHVLINMIKLIVVCALVVFLVVRYRARAATAEGLQTGKAVVKPAPTAPEKKAPRKERAARAKTADQPKSARAPRMRARMQVPLPKDMAAPMSADAADTFAVADAPMMDSPGADVSAELDVATAPVGVPDDTTATDGGDSPIPAPGWPEPREFGQALGALYDGEATSPDTPSATHADEGDLTLSAAHVATPSDADVDAVPPIVGSEAGWAEIDATEVGMDDAILPSLPHADDIPVAQGWNDDDGFDPASGWSDTAEDTTPAWSNSTAETPVTLDADAAWESAGAADPAASSSDAEPWDAPGIAHWHAPQADDTLEPPHDPVPSWDVADWAVPAVDVDDEPAADAFEITEPTEVIPLVASSVDDGVPTTVDAPVAKEPEAPAEELSVAADVPPPVEAAPLPSLSWEDATVDVSPLPEPVGTPWAEPEHVVEVPRSLLPVSADPTAPVIMYLQSGDQEMKVVIERDHTGNPIAWVLSGAAKIDAEGSAIRVRIPNSDDDVTTIEVDAAALRDVDPGAPATDTVADTDADDETHVDLPADGDPLADAEAPVESDAEADAEATVEADPEAEAMTDVDAETTVETASEVEADAAGEAEDPTTAETVTQMHDVEDQQPQTMSAVTVDQSDHTTADDSDAPEAAEMLSEGAGAVLADAAPDVESQVVDLEPVESTPQDEPVAEQETVSDAAPAGLADVSMESWDTPTASDDEPATAREDVRQPEALVEAASQDEPTAEQETVPDEALAHVSMESWDTPPAAHDNTPAPEAEAEAEAEVDATDEVLVLHEMVTDDAPAPLADVELHAWEAQQAPDEDAAITVHVSETIVATSFESTSEPAHDPAVAELIERLADAERALSMLDTPRPRKRSSKPDDVSPRKQARRRARKGVSAHVQADLDVNAPKAAKKRNADRAKIADIPAEPVAETVVETPKRARKQASGVATTPVWPETSHAHDEDAPPPRSDRVGAPKSRGEEPPKRRRERQPKSTAVDAIPMTIPIVITTGEPLDIAALVQAEANRRFAEVLAEHGSVKTNGDFSGLVTRLEHVVDESVKPSEA